MPFRDLSPTPGRRAHLAATVLTLGLAGFAFTSWSLANPSHQPLGPEFSIGSEVTDPAGNPDTVPHERRKK